MSHLIQKGHLQVVDADHALIGYAMKSSNPDSSFSSIIIQNKNGNGALQPTTLVAISQRTGYKVFSASTLLSFDDFKKQHHQFQNLATPNHAKPLIDGTVHGVTFDTGSSETWLQTNDPLYYEDPTSRLYRRYLKELLERIKPLPHPGSSVPFPTRP